MPKKLITYGKVLVFFSVFVFINLSSNILFPTTRIDFTQNQMYTLSSGTIDLIHAIKEPLIFRFYYSKKLARGVPALNDYAEHVKTLLSYYQKAAGHNIVLKIIDPEPFTAEEDQAISYGLKNIPLNKQGENFYFGLVGTNATGEQSIIALFSEHQDHLLEYEISKLIDKLNHPTRPTIGVITELPIAGDPLKQTKPWLIWEQLSQLYQVKQLKNNINKIPSDINILLLAHPRLTSNAQYAIDQYVLKGGRLIAFVDPYVEVARAINSLSDPAHADRSLQPLLSAWGIQYDPNVAISDRKTARSVRYKEGEQKRIASYPLWFDVNQDNILDTTMLTQDLHSITLASPGALEPAPQATTQWTPLFKSTASAMPINTKKVPKFRENPPTLNDNYFPSNYQFTFGALVTGNAQSAFKNNGTASHIAKSQHPMHVIAISDIDFLYDSFWAQTRTVDNQMIATPFASNAHLVLNAVDHLSGNNALISIRNHASFHHPFTRIENLKTKTNETLQTKRQTLLTDLANTQSQLASLSQQETSITLSELEQQQINSFRTKMLSTREQLRDVQFSLQRDIDVLQHRVILFNIFAIPVALLAISIIVMLFNLRHRRQRTRLAHARRL